jgi:hypothetical protein
MGLMYDNPDLAAVTLTRLAAEESEGPGGLDGRMHDYLAGRVIDRFGLEVKTPPHRPRAGAGAVLCLSGRYWGMRPDPPTVGVRIAPVNPLPG